MLFVLLVGLVIVVDPRAEDDGGPTIASLQPAMPVDPLPSIRAAIEALDMPVIVMGAQADLLAQNAAAERAFGDLGEGQHVSARWRSPVSST